MLVLSRKTGEKLIINDNIEITIIETRGDSVKIGINAPKNVSIYREEIFEEIRKNNKQSANNILQTNIDDVINIINKKLTQNRSIVLVEQDNIEHIMNDNKNPTQPIKRPIKNFTYKFII